MSGSAAARSSAEPSARFGPRSNEARERRATLLAAGAAFLLLGSVVALYGPLFPQLRAGFGVGIDEVGAVVSAHFLGSFVTVISSGVLLRRSGYRAVLLGGAGTLFIGLGVLALAPSWTVFVLGAAVVGLGFGAVQVAVNLLVARTFDAGAGAASALNLVNAVFGLGALIAPLLIALFAPGIAWPIALLAGLALAVLVSLARLERYPTPPARTRAGNGVMRGGTALVVGFIALYFFYVSAEVGVTSWATEHLTPTWGTSVGAAATSFYWGALTAGRLIAVVLARRMSPGALLLSGLTVGLAAMLLATYSPLSPFAYGVVGLALAPTFATGLAWLTAVMPRRAEEVTPLVLAAASLGPVSTAPLIGVIVAAQGVDVVPLTLAALTALALLSVVFLARSQPSQGVSSATT